MSKLWQTSTSSKLHPLVESYTVGIDYQLDQRLIPYDIRASKAHATMLHAMGIFSYEELLKAHAGLDDILSLWKIGDFTIRPDQEDGHTAIEEYLTTHYGDVGKKIHTGRSRNDQSLVMLRLFMREELGKIQSSLETLCRTFQKKSHETHDISMPGYTHLQKAMPTTVGTWFGSFGDAFADIQTLLPGLATLLDQNPLGSASGFGIGNFPLQREITTQEMSFAKTQQNPLYCGLSRGYFESIFLSQCLPMMILSGRFAQDMLIFTTSEFGFFSLPPSLTTGSSIMPQKRNYDVFEVMRANTKTYQSHLTGLTSIVMTIGSGYQRDLQVTKRLFLEALDLLTSTLEVLTLCVQKLHINEEKLHTSMTDDLYATEKVYDLVNQGMSFREAYGMIKTNILFTVQ